MSLATHTVSEASAFAFQKEILGVPKTASQTLSSASEKKDLCSVVAKYTDMIWGAKNLVCEPVNHAIDAALLISPQLPAEVMKIKEATTDGKNILSAMELPGKLNDLRHSVVEFDPDKPIESSKDVFLKLVDCYSPVYDGIDFLQSKGITNISSEVMKGLSIGNAAALTIGCGYGALDNTCKIANECGNIAEANLKDAATPEEIATEKEKVESSLKKILLHLMEVAKCVCYVAFGILSFIALVFGVVVAPWLLLALSATALLFTIGGYFYDKIVDPMKKETPPPQLTGKSISLI